MKLSTFTLAALLAGSGWLHAGVLNITLDPSTIELSPGQSFTFSGVISNTVASTVDLNNIDITLNGLLFQVDSSPFFSGPLTVAAGSDTPSFAQFSVTVDTPYNAAPGIQMGTLTILGGVEFANVYDPTTQNVLGSTSFDVDVEPTPEPSSFAMLAPAVLAGIGLLSYQRRRRRMARNG